MREGLMMTCDQAIKKLCAQYLLEEPDAFYRRQIELLLGDQIKNQKELANRMECLSFGTAGLRGKMEAGYNRMNLVSVYRFAYALGALVESLRFSNSALIVIGYDARENSCEFALEVARALYAMGRTVNLFDKSMPTPLVAYATKNLLAKAGVMITASHNPSYDNGIKLYDDTSSQVFGAWLTQIEINMKNAPKRCDFLEENPNLIDKIQFVKVDEIADNYFRDIKQTKFFTHLPRNTDIGIVYTPLHGVGGHYFSRALSEEGFDDVLMVPSQREPDGKFPTVLFPNPEENHTLDAAHKLALDRSYDFVFANDPDADRLQVSCKDKNRNFTKLSGNEMGVIFGYFAIKKATLLGVKPLLASSIVSSRMLKAMCVKMNAYYVDGITGFSNIIHAAKKLERSSGSPLVFAYEEAIGFSIGQVVLDKDGINAGARFVEIVLWLESSKKTIWQLLDDLYLQFGLFVNMQWSLRFDGGAATETMKKFMNIFRTFSTTEIGSILGQSDCQKFDLASGEKYEDYEDIFADVLVFEIKNHSRLIVRPSGTEPKIKFYLELFEEATNHQMLSDKRSKLNREIVNLKNNIENNLINRGLSVQ